MSPLNMAAHRLVIQVCKSFPVFIALRQDGRSLLPFSCQCVYTELDKPICSVMRFYHLNINLRNFKNELAYIKLKIFRSFVIEQYFSCLYLKIKNVPDLLYNLPYNAKVFGRFVMLMVNVLVRRCIWCLTVDKNMSVNSNNSVRNNNN